MNNETKKPVKIFITHSSEDKEYVLALTELLKNIRVPTKSIVCTSDPTTKVPNGKNIYSWLKEQFSEYDLHMIFVLSHNYFKSIPSLNEMGAAWVMGTRNDLFLLPGFSFKDLKNKECCLDKNLSAGSADSEEKTLKAWLENFKDDVIVEFGLEPINNLDWEEYRDRFIGHMKPIKPIEVKNKTTTKEGNAKARILINAIEKEERPLTKGEIVEITGLSEKTVRNLLQKEVNAGNIQADGSPRRMKYWYSNPDM